MAYTPELLAEKKRIEQHVKIGSEALYLTKAECMENGPTVEDTIAAVRKIFIAHGKKEYEMPAKIGVHPHDDVFYHAMPAYVPGQMAMGCKWIECYPRNPKDWGLPQTSSVLVLNELITGCGSPVPRCGILRHVRLRRTGSGPHPLHSKDPEEA